MTTIIRKRRLPAKTKADINITPLIDVLLVLIVIFMVITPQTPKGLETSVPQVLYNDVAQLIDVARGAGAARIGLLADRITAP